MLLNLMTAWVFPEHREPFERGQVQWRSLKRVEGFLGQTGGWAGEDYVCLASLWSDLASFQAHTQEGAYTPEGLSARCEELTESKWERVLDIPGSARSPGLAMATGGFMRIARCTVPKGRQAHFIEAQRTIWNQGMSKRQAMQGGFFGRRVDSPGKNEFLIFTFWRSPEAHQAYMNEAFPGLRAKAQPQKDCVSITGMRVPIEASWRIASAQEG